MKQRQEPASFDESVRRPGLAWLKERNIPLDRRLDPNTDLPPYWRKSLDDLHANYAGVCAYLCIFIERITGGCSVDHYVPKSRAAGLAYDWANYRLACSTMNARKRDFEDVLDPFTLSPDTFRLELVTGRLFPNPDFSGESGRLARATIDRLGLDQADARELRQRRFTEFIKHKLPPEFLREASPFIWVEAVRQGIIPADG